MTADKLLEVWSRVDTPGLLVVVRLGLTPAEIAALSQSEFLTRVCAERGGRRLWRAKVCAAHEKAARGVALGKRLEAAAAEARRMVARYDLLARRLTDVQAEVEEARWLGTIPGRGFASVAGIIAHAGPITRCRHGRQLIKLADTNPSCRETAESRGGSQAMSHCGRSGLRQVVYMATISCLAHKPRLRVHYDRLISCPERRLAPA